VGLGWDFTSQDFSGKNGDESPNLKEGRKKPSVRKGHNNEYLRKRKKEEGEGPGELVPDRLSRVLLNAQKKER